MVLVISTQFVGWLFARGLASPKPTDLPFRLTPKYDNLSTYTAELAEVQQRKLNNR